MSAPSYGHGPPDPFREWIFDADMWGLILFVWLPCLWFVLLGFSVMVFLTIVIVAAMFGQTWP